MAEREIALRSAQAHDGFVRGAGTASCGPDTLEKYRIPFQAPLKFEFAVQPVLGGDEK